MRAAKCEPACRAPVCARTNSLLISALTAAISPSSRRRLFHQKVVRLRRARRPAAGVQSARVVERGLSPPAAPPPFPAVAPPPRPHRPCGAGGPGAPGAGVLPLPRHDLVLTDGLR